MTQFKIESKSVPPKNTMPSEAADIQAKIQSLRPADASQRHARQTSIFWSGNRVSHRSGASIRHIVPQTWTHSCPGNCQLRTTHSRHANPHRRQRPRDQTNPRHRPLGPKMSRNNRWALQKPLKLKKSIPHLHPPLRWPPAGRPQGERSG